MTLRKGFGEKFCGKHRSASSRRKPPAGGNGRNGGRERATPGAPGAFVESPLEWLARRKGRDGRPLLSPEEVEAGERLRRDYEFGMLGPKVTSSWDPTRTLSTGRRSGKRGAGHDLPDTALEARERVYRALTHVGPGLSDILLEICCLSRGLEAAERRLGWPRRSARIVLRMALSRLAEHYGIGGRRERGRHVPILGWGRPGYSPDRALPEEEETEPTGC